jgi:hypothetical protein
MMPGSLSLPLGIFAGAGLLIELLDADPVEAVSLVRWKTFCRPEPLRWNKFIMDMVSRAGQ